MNPDSTSSILFSFLTTYPAAVEQTRVAIAQPCAKPPIQELLPKVVGNLKRPAKRCEKHIASSRVLGLIAAYPMIVAPRTPPTRVILLNAGCLGCEGAAGFCEITRTFFGRTALGASLTVPTRKDARISSASSEWPTSA
jgi:hypothetical protein